MLKETFFSIYLFAFFFSRIGYFLEGFTPTVYIYLYKGEHSTDCPREPPLTAKTGQTNKGGEWVGSRERCFTLRYHSNIQRDERHKKCTVKLHLFFLIDFAY